MHIDIVGQGVLAVPTSLIGKAAIAEAAKTIVSDFTATV